MKAISLFLLAASFLFFSPSRAQNLSFETVGENSPSGNLELWRNCLEGECVYALHGALSGSSGPAAITLTSNYRDGQLVSAVNRSQSQGVLQMYSGVKWNGEGYQFVQNGSFSALPNKAISTSLVTLFFQEPTGKRRVFLEADGLEAPLRHVAAHTYEVFRPNGERYRFLYDMGVCSWVLLENEQGVFTFRLNSASGSSSELMK